MTEVLEITTLRLAQGLDGAAGVTSEMGSSPVHDTIDHSAVDWRLTTVLQHVEGARS